MEVVSGFDFHAGLADASEGPTLVDLDYVDAPQQVHGPPEENPRLRMANITIDAVEQLGLPHP